MKNKRILITGAAGNLGSLAAKHFIKYSSVDLNLMYHQKELDKSLTGNDRVSIFKCDLADIKSIEPAVKNADVIIHFAGVLFKASPERFLPVTNIMYFENLVRAAEKNHVKKIVLISFPHVEGITTVENPATDRTDKKPVSIHAQTRLEEEKLLLNAIETPVILRVGMVYGNGIIMPDAAKWFAQKRLLCVWREPTAIHLISKWDFCECLLNAALKSDIRGIYNIGDEGIQTLQEFLDYACEQWNVHKPWRVPLRFIYFSAQIFEMVSKIFKVKSPLTKDFIDIGRVSYYGDTGRMKRELLSSLKYKNMREGKETF